MCILTKVLQYPDALRARGHIKQTHSTTVHHTPTRDQATLPAEKPFLNLDHSTKTKSGKTKATPGWSLYFQHAFFNIPHASNNFYVYLLRL